MKNIFLFLAVVVPSSCFAAPVLDQENLPTSGSMGIGGHTIRQQQVRAGMSGQLTSVAYWPAQSNFPNSGVHQFGISHGAPWSWEAPEWNTVVTVDFPTDYLPNKIIDTTDADFFLEEGELFTLYWRDTSDASISIRGSYSQGSDYPDGQLWTRHTHEFDLPSASDRWDAAFQTFMEPVVVVPEPTTRDLAAVLALAGLLFLLTKPFRS